MSSASRKAADHDLQVMIGGGRGGAGEAVYAYRPPLDGVRALAVLAVLLFHGGVSQLRGGFLGVDAFFVLSGFLITSLLLAERARTGTIRLGAFWGRRARRLLPALLVVLFAVVVAAPRLIPPEEVALLQGDALAALAYIANWRMIYRGDDYFAQTAAPSPLQHTWSLGIEEQFYLLWPPLVVVILLLGRRLMSARGAGATLIVTCLLGAAASAIAAAALYDPLNSNRAYFGTDTRAQALLVGGALAAMLYHPGRLASEMPSRLGGTAAVALTVAATAAVVTIAWLWVHADGAAALLYRGGFSLGAVAVAVVLAHVVLSPHAAISRVLALPPLVWLGKISYGLYLWHWPLFQYLNAERTGLQGPSLLTARLAATLAVATVSYILVEHPIRTRRWPHSLPRLTPVHAGLATTALMGATAVLVVVATRPSQILPAGPLDAAPSVAANPASNAPILRRGRKPGANPRITFLGDSVSWSLGTYLPPNPGLTITVRSVQGCGIARLPDIILRGGPHGNYPACPTWDRSWRRGVNADDPDVAVILLDRWELMDRRLGGVYQHVGQPDYDVYLAMELELAISIAGSRGAHVVVLTAPYTRRAERPDGGLYDEDRPERVDAWNRLIREVAGRHSDNVSVIDLNRRVCPEGKFTWTIDHLRIRSDGLHFTPQGVQRWIAPWLIPQLVAIAVGAQPAAKPPD